MTEGGGASRAHASPFMGLPPRFPREGTLVAASAVGPSPPLPRVRPRGGTHPEKGRGGLTRGGAAADTVTSAGSHGAVQETHGGVREA
jgi:hypothetical protein